MDKMPYDKPRITDEEEFAAMAGAWACAFNPVTPSCWGGNLPNHGNTFNQGANDWSCSPVHNS